VWVSTISTSLTLDYAANPVGLHLDLGAGHAFDLMGATEKELPEMRFVKQAYIDFKPAWWSGLELDFGQFASSAGAEAIETANNWNYSRSLLFTWCVPYYHFGFRANAPLAKHFTAGFQVVAGWDKLITGATYKTIGLTTSWSPTPKVTWTDTYYTGPDENKSNRGFRNLYET
jgi:hypothetical protein